MMLKNLVQLAEIEYICFVVKLRTNEIKKEFVLVIAIKNL